MMVVLDASALLAYLKGEPGGDRVDGVLAEKASDDKVIFRKALATL